MKVNSAKRPFWMELLIPQLTKAFWESWPHECCGVIQRNTLNGFSFQSCRNEVKSMGHTKFELDALAVLELCLQTQTQQKELLAWVHSHPAGTCQASALDIAFWKTDDGQWLWPGMAQVILWPDDSKQLHLSVYDAKSTLDGCQPTWTGPLTA